MSDGNPLRLICTFISIRFQLSVGKWSVTQEREHFHRRRDHQHRGFPAADETAGDCRYSDQYRCQPAVLLGSAQRGGLPGLLKTGLEGTCGILAAAGRAAWNRRCGHSGKPNHHTAGFRSEWNRYIHR